MSIANLNRPADAFEQLETEDGVRQGVCHIRIQQRTGRKTITTVQGIGTEYDLKRIVQYLKKNKLETQQQSVRMRPALRMLAKLALFRFFSVYLVASWFVPDELYQSAEVAHHLVYGTGHLSWEEEALFRSSSWYWYLVSGIPAVLTVQAIAIIIGLLGPNIFRPTLLPFFATAFYITVHSLLPHKEQRFLLPVIPLLCIYAGGAFQNLKKWQGSAVAVMIAVNVGVTIFTSRYHQVGPFTAPRRIMEEWRGPHGKLSVAALMPCYSLPGHAFWHDELETLRLLDCSPDLDNLRAPTELDESDQFHANATKWLIEKFSLEHRSYQRVLMYEKMYESSRQWFEQNGWHQCIEKIWHSIALTSSREDTYMIKHSCNGTIVEHPEYGEVIQLTGDQREKVKDFLIKVGIVNEANCRLHGF
ncbi:unnamed protein product [Caenorhabditis sp. 36 PRJEB53466]|nr:unnamed protein product [Caenorhabditis sp. 36 PRJEB53466]